MKLQADKSGLKLAEDTMVIIEEVAFNSSF